jgi:hypothetical protein
MVLTRLSAPVEIAVTSLFPEGPRPLRILASAEHPARVCQQTRRGSIDYGLRVKPSTKKFALKTAVGCLAAIVSTVVAGALLYAVLPGHNTSTAPTRSLHVQGRSYIPVELAPDEAAPPGLACFGTAKPRTCLVPVASTADLRTQKELRAAAEGALAAMSKLGSDAHDLATSFRRVGEGAGVVSKASLDSNNPWKLAVSLALTAAVGVLGVLAGFGLGRRRDIWPARTL